MTCGIDVLELPEGMSRPGFWRRLAGRGRRLYDPLWRYLAVAPERRGGSRAARIDLRSHANVPSRVDPGDEILSIGRRVRVPFASIRGFLVAHGLLPAAGPHAFDLLALVEGCDSYLPIHRFAEEREVLPLARALLASVRAPLGLASGPLDLVLEPGKPEVEHALGRTPMEEVHGVVAARSPDGRARVRLLAGKETPTLANVPDPDGALERAALVVGEVLSLAGRRFHGEDAP
jgi:hypothetical protein